MFSILYHLAQALPQPTVLPLYLITRGIATAHKFVQPALKPVGCHTAHSVLIIVWHGNAYILSFLPRMDSGEEGKETVSY